MIQKGKEGFPRALIFIPILAREMQMAPMLQFLLQSSGLDWEDSLFGRGWITLELEVTTRGRQLVLAVTQQRCGSGQGWRHPG